MWIRQAVAAWALAVASMASPGMSAAADAAFPARPIQVVIPFQPGDTDNMLRPFLDRMQEFLGQPVVLNYKPGAGGGIGAGSVADSKPDGYTLVGSSPGSLVVVPLANKEVKYRPDSFSPVASLAEGGLMLVVSASSKWKTIQDLVEDSRQRPGEITLTSSGALGITHLLAEAFAKEAGVKWTHVPFQGSTPAITALLGGHVDLASTAIAPAQAHIQNGTLRALAVFGERRLKAYPDVPTLRELGYRIGSPTLYGIAAPKGTPQQVVERLHQAARQVNEKYAAEIAATLRTFGAEPRLLGPAQYAEYLQGQNRLFSEAIRTLD